MPIVLKPGSRLFSRTCPTELIVVKGSPDPVEFTIGGYEPVTSADEREPGEPLSGHDGGTAMGKRYIDDDESVELLCTRAGTGVPALGGDLLVLKGAKALPSSD